MSPVMAADARGASRRGRYPTRSMNIPRKEVSTIENRMVSTRISQLGSAMTPAALKAINAKVIGANTAMAPVGILLAGLVIPKLSHRFGPKPVAIAMAGGYARHIEDTVDIHYATLETAAWFARS